MKKNSILVLGALSAAVAAAVVVGIAMFSESPSPEPDISHNPAPDYDIDFTETDPALMTEQLRSLVRENIRTRVALGDWPRTPTASDQLAERAANAIAWYASGSLEDMRRQLEDEGLLFSPDQYTPGTSSWSRAQSGMKTVQGMRIATDGIEVRPRTLAGRELDLPTIRSPGTMSAIALNKPRLASITEGVSAQSINTYEILVPAELTSNEGKKFHGMFGLIYTYDPTGRRWVQTGTAIYDIPESESDTAVIPPM